MKNTFTAAVYASILLELCVFCSKEYNPFSDYSNATTVLTHQSLRSNDTIEIFCTETLSAIILVKELIDSFVVHSSGNRLWRGADSIVQNSDFSKEPFTFLFSYCDTGRKSITISTFKSNGGNDSSSFILYVQSPLHQSPIIGSFGDSLQLRTPAVKDRDINYFWSFGAGARYSSQVCSTTVVLFTSLLSGRGGVWVSDGVHSSLADSFSFTVRDTAQPSIVCVNENFVGKDTIYTGDSVFSFKVRISNRGDQWVDSASINGRAFDRKENKVYYSLIDKMYVHDTLQPLTMNVYALSHFQNGVSCVKRFTLIFSSDVTPALPAEIKVLMPSRDSTYTLMQRYTISGVVENHSFDSLNALLYLYVNDSLDPIVKTLSGNVSCAWDWNINLSAGVNKILLQAKDFTTLSAIHQVSFSIFYADTAHDSLPPQILSVTANGAAANNFYTDKTIVTLGVKAFDEISGIDTLTINGRHCQTPDTGNWYYDSIALQHTQSGNEVLIRARDRKNNDTVVEVILYNNRLPVIQRFPASSFIAIDSLYTDTLSAFDPDNDTIVYEKTAGPPGLSVNSQGCVIWRPTQLDTGLHIITLRLWDGYQPVFRTYTVYAFGDEGRPGPVRFATTADDFPLFMEAGRDTLRMKLRVSSPSGIRPFLFSARITNQNNMLLPDGPDSVLIWAPLPSDTGFRQLIVSVRDAFPSSDTLYPRILIVRPNSPCSLSVNFLSDTTPTGALNLNKRRDKDTLIFAIKDPDNPFIERHGVTIYETRTQMSSFIDSAVVDSFSLILDPLAFDGYDTIIAIVRDRAGAVDTLKQKIYYGLPPYVPQVEYPFNYTQVNGTSVSLSWQDADPDDDDLTFDVYFGALPDQLSQVAITGDASYTVNGLSAQRTYYWRIVAHDWKSFTEGPVWQFTTR